jgi:hypothetical protein
MDEAPPCASVAVTEGVNGLELRVGERLLGNGRDVVAVHELDEVVEETADELVRRRNERRVAWREPAAADPVRSSPATWCMTTAASTVLSSVS